MPSAKIDFFWEGLNFFNLTYSKSEGAPRVTAPWKIKTAPKLPPKPKALPASSTPRPEPRPTINSTKFGKPSEEEDTPRIEEIEDVAEKEAPKPATAAKNIPKLKDLPKAKEEQNAEAGPSDASKEVPKSSTTALKKNIPKLKDTAANKSNAASKPLKSPAQSLKSPNQSLKSPNQSLKSPAQPQAIAAN